MAQRGTQSEATSGRGVPRRGAAAAALRVHTRQCTAASLATAAVALSGETRSAKRSWQYEPSAKAAQQGEALRATPPYLPTSNAPRSCSGVNGGGPCCSAPRYALSRREGQPRSLTVHSRAVRRGEAWRFGARSARQRVAL